MEKKIELEVLGLSTGQSQNGSFALVLGEKNGTRRLPIIIGMTEAQSIAIEIEKIKPNRPFTHDLFRNFCEIYHIAVEEIIITNLKEGIFYATMMCRSERIASAIDARPSDAIAIGLRFNAPIYVYAGVLEEAGIVLSEDEIEEEKQQELLDQGIVTNSTDEELEEVLKSDLAPLHEYTIEQLNIMLEDALQNEDYETAASIRDELKTRGE